VRLSGMRALLFSEATCSQGHDTSQATDANHCVTDAKGHELKSFVWLKRRQESKDTESGDGQQDQASDDGDDDSHVASDV
jgi:hypothetical protein